MAAILGSRRLALSSPPSLPSSSLAVPWRMPAERSRRLTQQILRRKQLAGASRATSEVIEPLTLSSAVPDLTWQITAGAIAGVTPFVVAGIEFSKRIIKQRRCQVCGGSGLVKRAGILVRCYGCAAALGLVKEYSTATVSKAFRAFRNRNTKAVSHKRHKRGHKRKTFYGD